MKTKILIAAAALFSILNPQPATLQAQGSLTPPGAPAPTMKSLDQLDAKLERRTPISSLPFSLTQSGSYYLTTNLTASGGYISIFAENVTLDLNGFTVDGSSTAPFAAVVFSGRNLTIRNGTLRGFGTGGTVVDGRNAACNYEGVQLLNNSGLGFWCGPGSRFFNCTFSSNTDLGIAAAGGAVVKNCTFNGNNTPMQLGPGSLVADCTILTNTGALSVGVGSTVRDCTFVGNGDSAIAGSGGNTILNCVVRSNAFNGIFTGNGSIIKNCIVAQSTQAGISCGSNSIVEGCLVVSNATDGIHTGGACVIVGNSAYANGAAFPSTSAGIHTTGSGSRIEDNQARGNGGYGIRSEGGVGADVIIRNTAGGNVTANFSPASGATFGPVQTPAAMTNALGNITF